MSKSQQHVRATHMLKEKAEDLKAKLEETNAALAEKQQWSDFWLDKTKTCHDELDEAREKHRGNFGEDNADNQCPLKGEHCKDILKEMEADMLAMLQDIKSSQVLGQKSGHLTTCLGQHLLKIVARRQEIQTSASAVTSPTTPVPQTSAPQSPVPQIPVVKQELEPDTAVAKDPSPPRAAGGQKASDRKQRRAKPPVGSEPMGCAARVAADEVLTDSEDDQWPRKGRRNGRSGRVKKSCRIRRNR